MAFKSRLAHHPLGVSERPGANDGTAGPSGRPTAKSLVWAGVLLLVVLPVVGAALLYAYRAQTPATERVPFAQVLTEIQAGQVKAVNIEGGDATVMLIDGRMQGAVAPADGQLARIILEHNQADPAHRIDLRSAPSPNRDLGVSVAIGFLPLLLLIALVALLAMALRRSARGHRYEELARLADLRDRAAITEDEFQREKRRILR